MGEVMRARGTRREEGGASCVLALLLRRARRVRRHLRRQLRLKFVALGLRQTERGVLQKRVLHARCHISEVIYRYEFAPRARDAPS